MKTPNQNMLRIAVLGFILTMLHFSVNAAVDEKHIHEEGNLTNTSAVQQQKSVTEKVTDGNVSRKRIIPDYRWGNACYFNLNVGDSILFNGKTVKLISVKDNISTLKVGGKIAGLKVSRLELPVEIDGVRVFIADSKPVKSISTDPQIHGALSGDALVCVSEADKPLLPEGKYIFPIGRSDGYQWLQEENSHMFSYLGLSTWIAPSYYRSHEGIDFNMHDARGIKKHPIIAIENGTVSWMLNRSLDKGNKEACVLLQSQTQSEIYYVYQHLNSELVSVKDGDMVEKGDTIGFIWGDQTWGHLHFGVVSRKLTPDYKSRYDTTLNFFPHMIELWNNGLEPAKKYWTEGNWKFNEHYLHSRNIRRLNSYAEINGYGWLLGNWCTAEMVEWASSPDKLKSNARLRKSLHQGTLAQADNPNDYYDFEINVANGDYKVQLCLGDAREKTWQQVFIEEKHLGTFNLMSGEFCWSESLHVNVADEKLTIRIRLKDIATTAGLAELKFEQMNKN